MKTTVKGILIVLAVVAAFLTMAPQIALAQHPVPIPGPDDQPHLRPRPGPAPGPKALGAMVLADYQAANDQLVILQGALSKWWAEKLRLESRAYDHNGYWILSDEESARLRELNRRIKRAGDEAVALKVRLLKDLAELRKLGIEPTVNSVFLDNTGPQRSHVKGLLPTKQNLAALVKNMPASQVKGHTFVVKHDPVILYPLPNFPGSPQNVKVDSPTQICTAASFSAPIRIAPVGAVRPVGATLMHGRITGRK